MKCIKRLIKNLKNVYKICFTKDWIFMRKYVYKYYVENHPAMNKIISEQNKQIGLLEDMVELYEWKEDNWLESSKHLLKTIDSLMGELIIAGYTEDEIKNMLNDNNYWSINELIYASKETK